MDLLSKYIFLALIFISGSIVNAFAQSMQEPSRGELLYSTYCGGCHSTEVNWREKKQVTDWDSLKSEVHRWQSTSDLKWSDDDIDAVSEYLNRRYYHFQTRD
jgi:mono/diheme cytochrome c family protein